MEANEGIAQMSILISSREASSLLWRSRENARVSNRVLTTLRDIGAYPAEGPNEEPQCRIDMLLADDENNENEKRALV